MREAVYAMRRLLDEGTVTYDGEIFRYKGIFTAARPKCRVPIYIGALGGPRSFQLAGVVGDGLISALGYSADFWSDLTGNMRIGAARSGRNFDTLELGGWVNFCVSLDSGVAKTAARSMVGFYIAAMPDRQLKLHGIDPNEILEVKRAFYEGRVSEVVKLTTLDLVEKLSLSGSPDEIVSKLRRDFAPYGVEHIVASIIDPVVCGRVSGVALPDIPDYETQMKLIMDRIAPEFK